MISEAQEIRNSHFPQVFRLREDGNTEDSIDQVAAFLSVSQDAARQIVEPEALFAD